MKGLTFVALLLIGVAVPSLAAANHASDAILPDLAMLQPADFRLERSGNIRLLRFSTVIVNLGPGLFDVYGSNPDPANAMRLTTVTQRLQQNGGWVEHPTEATMFYAGDGHNHWHVYGHQDWVLAFAATPNERLASGAKTGFCFWDNVSLWTATKYYSGFSECQRNPVTGTVPMGLSAGWGDRYPWNIAFQYIDVSQLPVGNYCLTVTADPLGQFVEVTKTNNQTRTLISITNKGVTALATDCGTTPATPTGLAATPGNGFVALDWNTNPDAVAGYTIYRDAQPIAMVTESSHTDAGLVNDTSYCYEVTAVDESGSESARSEVACATPTAGDPSLHVADLDGAARAKGKSGRWEASVTVTVHDHGEAPVAGAAVTGQWSGGASGIAAATTASDGTVTFSTGNMTSGTSVSFTIVSVAADGLAYDSAANADPDGDSNGTTITVSRSF